MLFKIMKLILQHKSKIMIIKGRLWYNYDHSKEDIDYAIKIIANFLAESEKKMIWMSLQLQWSLRFCQTIMIITGMYILINCFNQTTDTIWVAIECKSREECAVQDEGGAGKHTGKLPDCCEARRQNENPSLPHRIFQLAAWKQENLSSKSRHFTAIHSTNAFISVRTLAHTHTHTRAYRVSMNIYKYTKVLNGLRGKLLFPSPLQGWAASWGLGRRAELSW